MKIAVVGCGAVGSYYGAMLGRDGHDTHFLLRSDYEAVRCNGVLVRSVNGDFKVRPKSARRPKEIGVADLVLIALKTTANDQFAKLVPPLVGPNTIVLTLQNGLGNEEQLAELFSPEQVMGGLCFVCLNRIAPGVIHHIAHGTIVTGEFQRPPQPRTHEIAGMFKHAGVPCRATDNLARAHWEKLIWNIPFNGLGVAGSAGYEAVVSGIVPANLQIGSCLPTNKLLGDPHWEKLVRELMLEVIAAANKLGLQVSESQADKQIERTRGMGAYFASTLIDFDRRQPLELEGMFLEPLRQAQKGGVAAPRLKALCEVLKQLDARRSRQSKVTPGHGRD
jgi:2-dehydropantoate 2-reductase